MTKATIAKFEAGKHVQVRINDVTTRLSHLEACATLSVAELGLGVMGGKTASDLHQDNMTWFNQSDIMNALGISTMAARGLMTFLNRKGIAVDNGKEKGDPRRDTWTLTEHGINVAQALMADKRNNVGDYVLDIKVHD